MTPNLLATILTLALVGHVTRASSSRSRPMPDSWVELNKFNSRTGNTFPDVPIGFFSGAGKLAFTVDSGPGFFAQNFKDWGTRDAVSRVFAVRALEEAARNGTMRTTMHRRAKIGGTPWRKATREEGFPCKVILHRKK